MRVADWMRGVTRRYIAIIDDLAAKSGQGATEAAVTSSTEDLLVDVSYVGETRT